MLESHVTKNGVRGKKDMTRDVADFIFVLFLSIFLVFFVLVYICTRFSAQILSHYNYYVALVD